MERVPLGRVDRPTRLSRPQVFQRLAGELAVAWKLPDPRNSRRRFPPVRVPRLLQLADHAQHFGDVRRRLALDIRLLPASAAASSSM